MTLTEGTKLGRYEIRSLIGVGGMGEVYLAEDTKLDRKVALKVLPAEVAQNADRMQRFIREAKAASSLNHPNIAHIYEIGEADGKNYIATELIDGKTLRDHLSHKKSLQLNQILKIAAQVSEALSATHHAGIIHRDIKPENIMIRKDGYAKVLDFGLAKLLQVRSAERVMLSTHQRREPKKLTTFTSERINGFDYSRDGKQIAMSRGTNASDVLLYTNLK